MGSPVGGRKERDVPGVVSFSRDKGHLLPVTAGTVQRQKYEAELVLQVERDGVKE